MNDSFSSYLQIGVVLTIQFVKPVQTFFNSILLKLLAPIMQLLLPLGNLLMPLYPLCQRIFQKNFQMFFQSLVIFAKLIATKSKLVWEPITKVMAPYVNRILTPLTNMGKKFLPLVIVKVKEMLAMKHIARSLSILLIASMKWCLNWIPKSVLIPIQYIGTKLFGKKKEMAIRDLEETALMITFCFFCVFYIVLFIGGYLFKLRMLVTFALFGEEPSVFVPVRNWWVPDFHHHFLGFTTLFLSGFIFGLLQIGYKLFFFQDVKRFRSLQFSSSVCEMR